MGLPNIIQVCMEKTIFSGSVKYIQVMDEHGRADSKLMPKLAPKAILKIYELMKLTRAFDNKAFSLQRQGLIGTFAPVRGQEATQIGSALALAREDWLFPMYRDMGSYIALGMPMHMLFQYWAWDERGQKIPEKINAFTMSIPVGTHVPHAVGFAMAARIKHRKLAVLVDFGDGATSKGDFHEGMNLAGVFNAPVVFLCENNQYAISMPRAKQTAAETLAQKALAYGFEGVEVDGNDIFAVYRVVKEALAKARAGKGPTLIECFTYRLADHTTADDASRYRKASEVKKWEQKDPIARLRKYLEHAKLWNKKKEAELDRRIARVIEAEVEKFKKITAPQPDEFFDYVFEKPTAALEEQRAYLKKILAEGNEIEK